MKNNLPYTSSIKDMPLMFSEMKRTALLLCEGKTGDEIVRLSVDENIYQLDKVKRRRGVPLRMIKRLSTINRPLLDGIASGCESDAKVVAFLALMQTDRLLFEYMYEVYKDKFQTGFDEIAGKDFLDFIERKAQNSETIAKWSAGNLSNVHRKIKSSLCEAGLAKRKGNGLLIQKPIVDDDLRKLLKDTDKRCLRAMLIEG